MRSPISLNAVTAANHEAWLSQQDRTYSPYGKPYDQLTVEQRKEVSLTIVNTLDYLKSHGALCPDVEIIDDIGSKEGQA